MRVLVVRHAIAEERASFARSGEDDEARPLSEAGRRKFARGARGLAAVVPSIDRLATSRLVRAEQTADLVRAVYGIARAARLGELEPDADPAALLVWLRRHRGAGVVAVVGHEPHLSRFVALALAGAPRDGLVELGKGGACLVDLGSGARPGRGTLLWLLTPRQLRRLA